MTEAEWLNGTSPQRCGVERSVQVEETPLPCTDQPTYTISEACRELDEWRAAAETTHAWWLKEYSLLAEQLEEVRESRERLRIRVMELEGVRDELYDDLRIVHSDLDRLQGELATAKSALAHANRKGW